MHYKCLSVSVVSIASMFTCLLWQHFQKCQAFSFALSGYVRYVHLGLIIGGRDTFVGLATCHLVGCDADGMIAICMRYL